jgi:growth arrest-specific protein 2
MITPASDEATISETKPESPISDEAVDSIKEIETKFAKSGIVMNDDEISVNIATTTGLRKTGFSEVLYEDNPLLAAKKAVQSRIPKSPMLTRRKSMDNCSTINDDEPLRRIPAYRSVRRPHQQKDRTPLKENTWNGRSSVSPTNQAKKRPTITSDTFKSPSRTASLTRNTPARSSQQFDARTRQRSSTRTSSSVNTSPNKTNNNMQSPLAQQLLEAAGKARNDAQILGKIKQILNDYATKNKVNGEFDDFTATWVNNNGNLDNANEDNESSPIKSLSKRSSSISTSSDSNPTTSSREAAAAVISPRRSDKGISRIPAPVRSNTGLY